ncbi:MAG: hypothetical protein ACRDQC_16025, partial [Gaiellales bacterium]
MLATRVPSAAGFSRRDAARLSVAAALLVAVLTTILSADILPRVAFRGSVGDLAPADVYAPRATTLTSQSATDAARAEARRSVDFVYDYSPVGAQLSAAQELAAFDRTVAAVDAAFAAGLSAPDRRAALAAALPELPADARTTLQALDAKGWASLRTEMQRVLGAAQVQEVRDTDVPAARAALATRISLAFPDDQRALAGSIVAPLVVANSSYDAAATERAREQAAAAVQPVTIDIKQGELIGQAGARLT